MKDNAKKPNFAENAKALAKRELHVFPLGVNSKEPAIKGYPKRATGDAEQIDIWAANGPHRNVGVSTTDSAHGPLLVADIDDKDGRTGTATILQLELQGCVLPPTLTVRTTSGGLHYYFKVPFPVTQGTDVFGPGSGVDTRGKGGYVVGPGSIVNGGVYEIIHDLPIAPLPEWFLSRCQRAPEGESKAGEKLDGIDSERAYKRGEEWLKSGKAPEGTAGGRNKTAFVVAATLKDFGNDRDVILELMEDHWICSPPPEPGKLEEIISNVFKYARDPQGSTDPGAAFDDDVSKKAQEEAERKAAGEAAGAGSGSGGGDSGGASGAQEKPPRIPRMALPVMLEKAVLLTEGSQVALIDQPRIVYSLSDFTIMMAGARTLVEVGKKVVSKPTVTLWIEHPDRMTVTTRTHAPGQPLFCEDPNGRSAINTWRPRARVKPERAEEFVAAILGHIEYLVPVEAERESFLDWFAHAEQKPGELPAHHHLWVTPQTGIGRNLLGAAIGKVFPSEVTHGFDLGASIRSGFNGSLSGSLFAIVDELHEGGPGSTRDRNMLSEKLKSTLTEQLRLVNPKYGRQYYEFNVIRWLMFSNHAAALPLAENDRRVAVTANPTERKPPEYYTRLYKMLNEPGFGDAIGLWLRERDISKFNPGALAPMNEAKKATIRAGRTELEQAARDIGAEWHCDLITNSRLKTELRLSLGEEIKSVQGCAVAAGFVKLSQRPRIDGERVHVWCIRNYEKWKGAQPEDIAVEIKLRDKEEVERREEG